MYADLAAQYAVPLFPTFFAGLLAEAGTQDAVLQFMQSDGIHPNEDGVKLIVAAMGPSVLELVETAR